MMIIFPLAFILGEVVIRVNFRDPPGISGGWGMLIARAMFVVLVNISN